VLARAERQRLNRHRRLPPAGGHQAAAIADEENPDVVTAMVSVDDLNVAIGAGYRRENYQIIAGEPDSYRDGGVPNSAGGPAAIGAQVFPGFRPSTEVDESRNSVAAFVDVEGDVLNWLRFGAVARTERYSDFGSTVDGKEHDRIGDRSGCRERARLLLVPAFIGKVSCAVWLTVTGVDVAGWREKVEPSASWRKRHGAWPSR
jgi:hypothetical protein